MTASSRSPDLAESWPIRIGSVLLLHGTVLVLGLTLACSGAGSGREDWDYFVHHYEAMRRTVVEYHQFPWWNPWCCGGLPLAANPQVGVASINFFCVCLLGTYRGLRWAAAVHLLLAAEGARRLAMEFLHNPVGAALSGLVYAANGSIALYFAVGHLGIELAAWVPWVIWLALRIPRDSRWGWGLGAALAAAVHTSFQYFIVYTFLVLGALAVASLWVSDPAGRRRVLWGGVAAASVFLVLAGMRTALAAELVLDFPRGRFSQMDQRVGLVQGAVALLWPGQSTDFVLPNWAAARSVGWHEYGCYVGVLPCVLFLVSLRSGWRWWHTLAAGCFWLASGNTEWFHPSAWLERVPLLSMLRVATRWRVIGLLGVSLGAGAALTQMRSSPRGWIRRGAMLVTCVVAADLLFNAWPVFRDVFVVDPVRVDRPAVRDGVVQLHSHPPPDRCNSAMLATLESGYGVIYGYEPLLGVSGPAISARVWLGHADYRGEYWSTAGPVRLAYWSPNRIRLQAQAGADVYVNQNPGSYWVANGSRVFAHLRSVDRHESFQVRGDAAGQVELWVWPSGWMSGIVLTAVGVVAIIASAYGMNRELRQRNSQHEQHPPS